MRADSIRAAIDSLPVSDVHTHLDVDCPTSKDLCDILLYHHLWIELISAGMPQTATSRSGLCQEVQDPEMEPEDRIKACLPYLPLVRNTTIGYFLKKSVYLDSKFRILFAVDIYH